MSEYIEKLRAAEGYIDGWGPTRQVPLSTAEQILSEVLEQLESERRKVEGLPDQHELARWFHETYETLAPYFGYETRPDSAVPWDQVPTKNRELMTSVADSILLRLRAALQEDS